MRTVFRTRAVSAGDGGIGNNSGIGESGVPADGAPSAGHRPGSDPKGRVLKWAAAVCQSPVMACQVVGALLLGVGWLGEIAILVARDAVQSEPAWATDDVTICLMYGTVLFIAVSNEHLGLVTVRQWLTRLWKPFDIIPDLVMVAAFAAFAWVSADSVIFNYRLGAQTGVSTYPLWLLLLVGPIAAGGAVLNVVARLIRKWPGDK
jgi:TRAP-type C4-dicarboxylate transport system permease small subunit